MASLLKKLDQMDTLSENDKAFRSNLVSPNNQELVSRAVSDKTNDFFKFPIQALQRNPSHSSQNQHPSDLMSSTNPMISPRAFNFCTNITSPRDITSAILSPKNFRAFATSPQNNRSSPKKTTLEKPEFKREAELNPIVVAQEKAEPAIFRAPVLSPNQAQTVQPELPKTPSFLDKGSSVSEGTKDGETKKGNKYYGLTINTEIVNAGEKRVEILQGQTKTNNGDASAKNMDSHNRSVKPEHDMSRPIKCIHEAPKLKSQLEETQPGTERVVKFEDGIKAQTTTPKSLQFGPRASPAHNEPSSNKDGDNGWEKVARSEDRHLSWPKKFSPKVSETREMKPSTPKSVTNSSRPLPSLQHTMTLIPSNVQDSTGGKSVVDYIKLIKVILRLYNCLM